MDVKIIEQKQLVERYLFGRLTPPEAKFFEQMVQKSPELAERMGLPAALRRAMHLLDETGHDWREQPPRFWHAPWVPAALGGALLATLVTALVLLSGKHSLEQRTAELRAEVERGALPAPTRSNTVHVLPTRPGEAAPLYILGSRATPTLAELRLNVAFVKDALFAIDIRRSDGTYWGRIDDLVRDSNGDLRLALNTAAFAAGLYDVELNAVNLRGEGAPIGHVQLRVDAR